MKYRAGHILMAGLALLLVMGGCSRRARVIPASTMAALYAEMFIADQWLNDHSRERRVADTTDFYEPIFREFGYSFKDYNRSVEYYLDHPEKYARLLEVTSSILESRISELKVEEARINEIKALEKYLKDNALEPIDFALDTILWRPDTIHRKPIVNDKGRDSLRTDTLKAARIFLGNKPSPQGRKTL